MSPRQYFFKALFALASALLLLGLCNWFINPIRLFTSPDIRGLNWYKTTFFMDTFVSKPYVVSRTQPDGVIFGTSRAGASLNTDHPGWSGYRAYNFALPGSTALIQWRNFQHASAGGNLRLALVSLDFLMFNSCNDQAQQPHFQAYLKRLRGGDNWNWRYAQSLFTDYFSELTSWDTLRRSWTTLRSQALFEQGGPRAMHLLADGFWQSYSPVGQRQRRAFQRTEKQYMTSGWFPAPLNCFQLQLDGEQRQLDHLGQLLARAHAENTAVILYFSPFHARFAEAMHFSGLWPQFEQLKREVVGMNAISAEAASRQPYPLWDFSGYNSVNTEPVPGIDDNRTRMKYFFDGTHSTPLTGKLIQDVVFAITGNGEQAPADFGVRLQSGNIENLLAADRLAREAWVSRNGKDVEEIRALL